MPKPEPRAQAQATVVQTSNPQTDGAKRPVHTLRHRSIKAAVWRNETEKGPMFNVTLSRSFRDDSGQWRDSHSIGYDDLMNVAALMYEAHAYISSVLAKESEASRGGARR